MPGEFTSDQGFTIVVGPITFPEYLDRTEIVTRSSSNKITVSDFDVWAGSLAEDFSQVLAENLSILLSTDNVIVYPRPRPSSVDYQITVDVIRFDGPLGGDVSLIARWAILEGKEKKLVSVRKSTIIEPSGAKGYEAMVAADSLALEKLSRQIAEAIRALRK
ncbi:MAG TPA: PqiC family protein [Thermodesulfobacteriota bacterium]|nr:PqiC family protein [Thermodesulfobacteriota bacterium]